MDKFTFNVQNVIDGDGIGISLTGMFIVFCALTIIALFISILPWLMEKLAPILPKGDAVLSHDQTAKQAPVAPAVDENLVAAIGYALFQKEISDD